MGNASVDDTDIATASTIFFATEGKSFVPTFNCSIHNTSKCQTSRLLIHLCVRASFFIDRMRLRQRGPKHGRIWWGRGRWHWQWRSAVIELFVLLCQDYANFYKKTMYFCVKTMNCHWFISCCLDCYILFLLYAQFWRLPIHGGSQNRDYIKNQYIS
jgi:hypothetical protein